MKKGSNFILLYRGNPIFLAPFIDETILPPFNGTDIFVKNPLAIHVRIYFWGLNSIPLVYMSIFMPVPPCFECCSFVVSFEIWKCESSNLILFQDCFGYSGTLRMPYESENQLFHFCTHTQK